MGHEVRGGAGPQALRTPRPRTPRFRSSLAGRLTAFGLQQTNMRAAANHEIQSPGGQITKRAQRAIWDLQPVGCHELFVAPMNVHDELMVVTKPEYVPRVTEKVREVVESYRPQVPLIGMTWNEAQDNWADKKGGSITVKMAAPEMQ